LHPFDVSKLLIADIDGNGRDDVIVVFPGLGLWSLMNQGAWTLLHPFSATHIAAGNMDGTGGADLVIDFGAGAGVWTLRNKVT
jgi:hypothetical protein